MEAPLYTRTEPILLPYFPRLFYLALREQGFGDEQIFAGMDFGAEQLNKEAFRLSIEQHEQFILRMLDLSGDPHFALQLVEVRDQSASNLPMLAAANSGHIAKALQVIARYSKIITRVFTVNMSEEPPRLDLTLHVEHEQVAYFAVSSLALFINRFFQDALEGGNLVQRMDLPVPSPPGFASVASKYPFELRFDQAHCGIYLDGQALDTPIGRADPQTLRLLTDMAEQQLREADAETSLEGALRALLLDHLAAPPKLDDAARILNLSPRSLRRKLAESGTSYQGVLDAVRLAVASRLIRETDRPIAAIGYELGFTNPSDFGRAFKKWSGQPPSAYRQQA